MQRDRRNARLSLADLDFLGVDSELQAQAEQAIREADCRPTPGLYTGRDGSGSIAVLVDPTGQVEDVTVARDWHSRVGVSGVADAIFVAYTAALHAALETAALQELQQPGQQAAAPSAREPDDGAVDEVDEHLWLRRTWRTLHDIDADLDQLAREPEARTEQIISSPHGCLALRLHRGSVTAITGDIGRVARLDADQLRDETRSLFRAYELARSRNRS